MSNSLEQWDAVVIGSGIGGLVCANYLAVSGLRVLVLEQHSIAGGNAHVFRRQQKYEFDVGVHYLGECGKDGIFTGILAGLGLGGRVEFRPMDPDGFDTLALPSRTLRVPADWDLYQRRLLECLPAEIEGVKKYLDVIRDVDAMARRSTLGVSLPMLAAEHPVALRWRRSTLAELFDGCGFSALARTVLAAQSVNYGSAPDRTTVFTHATMIGHYLGGAYYPVGGGQELVAALVECLEANGGRLRTRRRVERILVRQGRVTGVCLADGEEIASDIVVSNADYRRTILELCGGADCLPEATVRLAQNAVMRLPALVLYLALDTTLPQARDSNLWWFGTEDIEGAYAELDKGTLDELSFAIVSYTSAKDPSTRRTCPPNHTNLQVITLSPHQEMATTAEGRRGYRRDASYLAEKRRLTELMLATAERAIGPFRAHLRHAELATPLTHQRYVLSSAGTPYGLATWGTGGARPGCRTDVEGLYLTGQSLQHGSGVVPVAINGVACAGQILNKPLLPMVARGAVVGDSSLLPVRGEDWDPISASRDTVWRRGQRGVRRGDKRTAVLNRFEERDD